MPTRSRRRARRLNTDVEAASEALGLARQKCDSSPSAAKSIAALDRDIKRRAEAQRIERENAEKLEQVIAALEAHDPGRARSLATATPSLRPTLANDQRASQLIFENLDQAFESVLSGSRSDAPRLCESRKLYILVFGVHKWRTIVRKLAEMGDDAIVAAKRVKLLNSGSCH